MLEITSIPTENLFSQKTQEAVRNVYKTTIIDGGVLNFFSVVACEQDVEEATQSLAKEINALGEQGILVGTLTPTIERVKLVHWDDLMDELRNVFPVDTYEYLKGPRRYAVFFFPFVKTGYEDVLSKCKYRTIEGSVGNNYVKEQ